MTDDTTTQAARAMTILRPCFSGTIPMRFGGVWATLDKAAGRYTLHLTDVDAPIDAARLAEYAAAFGVVTVQHLMTGHTAMLAWEVDGDKPNGAVGGVARQPAGNCNTDRRT